MLPSTNIHTDTTKYRNNNHHNTSTKKSPLNKERDLVKQKMAKCQPEKNWYSYVGYCRISRDIAKGSGDQYALIVEGDIASDR